MKRKLVFKHTVWQDRLPIWSTMTLWLFLDGLHAAGWVWGVLGTVMALGWITIIVGMCLQDTVDPFDADKTSDASIRWRKFVADQFGNSKPAQHP